MHLTIDERSKFKADFLQELTKLSEIMPSKDKDKEKIEQFEKLLTELDKFPMDMLPYSTASGFIYEINDAGVEHFFEYMEEMLKQKYENNEQDDLYKKAIKLLEHLELATAQKAHLFKKQEQQLNELGRIIKQYEQELNQSFTQFELFKADFNQYTDYLDEFNEQMYEFDKKFEKIEKSTEQITVNLISILGIFAAILLGAYGSIQGFSNVFANAKDMTLGKVIMISSIGGSSVLIILFFLLSSLAKLTSLKLGYDSTKFIERHPIIFFSHGILAFTFSFGLVIEVIRKGMKPDITWFWLCLPVVILAQILYIYRTKSIWGIFHKIKNIKKPFKSTFIAIIFTCMLLIIFAFYFGYIESPY